MIDAFKRISAIALLSSCFFFFLPANAQNAAKKVVQLSPGSPESLLKSHLALTDPYRVDCMVFLGIQAVNGKNLKLGENYFKQVLASTVKNERTVTNRTLALSLLGIVNMMNMDYTHGKIYLAEGIKLSDQLPAQYKPIVSELLAGYSMAVYETGFYDEAEKTIKQARVLKPNCVVCGEVEDALAKADRRPDYLAANPKPYVRWNDQTKVIRIFVQQPDNKANWHNEYTQAVKESFSKWQSAIDNKITFEYVTDPSLADVNLKWIHQGPKGGPVETGENLISYAGSYMVHNDIHIYLYTEEGVPIVVDEVYATILHEIGHMLGIQGHSNNQADVMSEGCLGRIITKRDIETFNKLYSVPAEYTNPTGMTLGEYRQKNNIQ